jgi:hypothetical protein
MSQRTIHRCDAPGCTASGEVEPYRTCRFHRGMTIDLPPRWCRIETLSWEHAYENSHTTVSTITDYCPAHRMEAIMAAASDTSVGVFHVLDMPDETPEPRSP